MYDRENDNRNNEGRQVQQELEEKLKERGLRDKYMTMVGGSPVTKRWAEKIGATAYSEDASECCDVALKLIAEK